MSDRGRPSKIEDEEIVERILEFCREGGSMSGAAEYGGISMRTLSTWIEKGEEGTKPYSEFLQRFRRARGEGQKELVEIAKLDGDAKWLLATSHGYIKTERQEHVGAGGGPIQKEVEVETKNIITEYEKAFDDGEEQDEDNAENES